MRRTWAQNRMGYLPLHLLWDTLPCHPLTRTSCAFCPAARSASRTEGFLFTKVFFRPPQLTRGNYPACSATKKKAGAHIHEYRPFSSAYMALCFILCCWRMTGVSLMILSLKNRVYALFTLLSTCRPCRRLREQREPGARAGLQPGSRWSGPSRQRWLRSPVQSG